MLYGGKRRKRRSNSFFRRRLEWMGTASLSLSRGKEEKDKKGKIKFVSAVVTFPPSLSLFLLLSLSSHPRVEEEEGERKNDPAGRKKDGKIKRRKSEEE